MYPNTQQAMAGKQALRLDASESVWFRRELEFVDEEQYQVIFEENRARLLIPSQNNVPDWASVYTWRQFTKFGKAKIVANMSDDIPRVDVSGVEQPKIIKPIADAYGWDIFEIKRSIAQGTHLDAMKAASARYAVETEIDRILALGDAEHNLDGLLTFDTKGAITPVTAITKTGGGTNWSAAATPTEISGDVFKLIESTVDALKGSGGPVFQKFRVVMPDANYLRIAQRGMNDSTGRTILEFILKSPYIESVNPWHRCVGAAANGTDDRICIFPPNPVVVAGIVPMEFTPQEPEKRNLEYVIDCVATCGGVVIRYPVAIGYMDAIDAV
jgi:hypothetical protein